MVRGAWRSPDSGEGGVRLGGETWQFGGIRETEKVVA